MNEKMTKRQHYVPQFYLNNFSNNGKLWAYDRKKKNLFESISKDICYEKYLYETMWEDANIKLGRYVLPNKIEKDFANQEREYSLLLRKIVNICNNPENTKALVCDTDEKRTLASFVANILLRNPWSLKQAKIDIVSDDMYNENIQAIDSLLQDMNFGGTKSLVKAAKKIPG